MAKLDNPAGRLHTLLAAFAVAAQQGGSVLATWAEVFGTTAAEETLTRIGEAAALVHETEQALIRYEDEDQLAQFYDYAGDWVRAVIFPRSNIEDQAAIGLLPDRRILNTLAGTSGFLSAVASEGPIPPRAQRADAYVEVQSALDAVRGDSELPPELRRELAAHLRRVLDALGTFDIGGPDAVQAALARLRVAVVFAPKEAKETSTWKKVAAAGGAVWVLFTSGPTVQAALEAWGHIAQALPPGTP